MAALDVLGAALVAALGLGLLWHYGLMCVAARRAPVGMLIAYPLASVSGFGAVLFSGAALWLSLSGAPAMGYLLAGLWFAVVGASAALVVSLRAHREGVKMCDVMDHAEALRAAKQVHSVLSSAQRDAAVLGERMTYRTWDALASMDQDPRDKPRKDAP